MKPQAGCSKLPECNTVSSEKGGFNGSINFCNTLKTSAFLCLCFPYEVNNFCLVLSLVQLPVKSENNLHFSSVYTFCRFYGTVLSRAVASRFKHQELKPLRRNWYIWEINLEGRVWVCVCVFNFIIIPWNRTRINNLNQKHTNEVCLNVIFFF